MYRHDAGFAAVVIDSVVVVDDERVAVRNDGHAVFTGGDGLGDCLAFDADVLVDIERGDALEGSSRRVIDGGGRDGQEGGGRDGLRRA